MAGICADDVDTTSMWLGAIYTESFKYLVVALMSDSSTAQTSTDNNNNNNNNKAALYTLLYILPPCVADVATVDCRLRVMSPIE